MEVWRKRRLLISLLAALLLAAASVPCGQTVSASEDWQWPMSDRFPRPVVPPSNSMSTAKVELGRHLFYDRRLSGNGSQSCADCHQQKLAYTDGLARAKGSTGEAHPRGSMSLVNVAYTPLLTWAHPTLDLLEDQALVPMFGTDPVELGLAGQQDLLLARLGGDATYRRLFSAAFPGESLSLEHVTKALAAFQRSIISFRSPYDRYRYLREEDAISDAAKRGMIVFFSGAKGGCFQCHGGLNFSGPLRAEGDHAPDVEFHNTGLYNLTMPPGAYPGRNTGLHAHTGRPADMGAFRAPTLRNIRVTAPYMHDGSIQTLEEVIAHYEQGGRARSPYTSTILRPFRLTDQERADLLAFLDSLTDEAALVDPRWSDPWPAPE